MSKAGEGISKRVRATRAYTRGEVAEGFVAHVPNDIDVRALRRKLDLSRTTQGRRS
jgi:putative transcriptional regulator